MLKRIWIGLLCILLLAVTLKEEGVGLPTNPTGYVVDSGGPTAYGIDTPTLEHAHRLGLTAATEVTQLTPLDVGRIYEALYWDTSRAADIPAPLDLAHFDAFVNMQPWEAWKVLQRALGVADDGVPGPVTMDAAGAGDPLVAAEAQLQQRVAVYRQIATHTPSEAKCLREWLVRCQHIATACGVADPTREQA